MGLSLHAPWWRPVFCLVREQVHFLCPLVAVAGCRGPSVSICRGRKPSCIFALSAEKISSCCACGEKHVSNKRRKWWCQLGLRETVQMKFKEGVVAVTVFIFIFIFLRIMWVSKPTAHNLDSAKTYQTAELRPERLTSSKHKAGKRGRVCSFSLIKYINNLLWGTRIFLWSKN